MICRLPHFITIDNLAKQLNLQPETIRLGVKAGAIPCYPFTKRIIRFDLEEVRAVLQTRLKEHELVKSRAATPKKGAEAATSTRNYNMRRKIYFIGSGTSSRKSNDIAVWLIAELAAMGKALSDSRLRDLKERQIIRSLRQSTINKLRAVTT